MNSNPAGAVQAELGYSQTREGWVRHVCSDRRLSLGTKLVAVAISWFFNFEIFDAERALVAWPTALTLSRSLGCDPDTIWTAIRALEQAGHLRVVRRYVRINGKQRQPNSYTAIVPSSVGNFGKQYRNSRQDSSSYTTTKKERKGRVYREERNDEQPIGDVMSKVLNRINPGKAAGTTDGGTAATTETSRNKGE